MDLQTLGQIVGRGLRDIVPLNSGLQVEQDPNQLGGISLVLGDDPVHQLDHLGRELVQFVCKGLHAEASSFMSSC